MASPEQRSDLPAWERFHTDVCDRRTSLGGYDLCTCGLTEAVEAYVEERVEQAEIAVAEDAREHGENW